MYIYCHKVGQHIVQLSTTGNSPKPFQHFRIEIELIKYSLKNIGKKIKHTKNILFCKEKKLSKAKSNTAIISILIKFMLEKTTKQINIKIMPH